MTSKAIFMSVLISTVGLLSGCRESEVREWMQETERFRNEARAAGAETVFRAEQHVVLKNYFSRVVSSALQIKDDDRLTTKLNRRLESESINALCGKLMISRIEWEQIISKCTRNSFFLCTEETKAYADAIQTVRSRLSAENKAKFDNSQACKIKSH